MAARGLKKAFRWFPHSNEEHHHLEEDEGSSERRGLLRSHLEQVVPVTDLEDEPNASSSAVKEPKVRTTLFMKSSFQKKNAYSCF